MTAPGLIVARNRRDTVIEATDGRTFRALVRGRSLRPVTGDEALWREQDDGTAVIEEILPRRSLLERIDSRGRAEGVAANVTALIVVLAPRPQPDWLLADRYLVAAELLGIEAALVRNKTDIDDTALDGTGSRYREIGYAVLPASAHAGTGLDALREFLRGHRSVLVGQSGVGKSSLLNALLGDEAQAVGKLSERRDLGRHTTTAAMLYRLPGGGELIDSPGVRRYSPYIPDRARLARGFRDFRPWLGQCRFNDCRHEYEPDCAIRKAVERGLVEPERHRSYLALAATLETLNR